MKETSNTRKDFNSYFASMAVNSPLKPSTSHLTLFITNTNNSTRSTQSSLLKVMIQVLIRIQKFVRRFTRNFARPTI